jgi:ribosomal silencing factor RsfS
MDYKDIIVHIFDQENRLFYDLEKIWKMELVSKQIVYKKGRSS